MEDRCVHGPLEYAEYLWVGVKRDRLVWVGDLHPEVMTVSTVFGYNEVVPKSLDLIRDITPLPSWMNGISSYSIWWLIDPEGLVLLPRESCVSYKSNALI